MHGTPLFLAALGLVAACGGAQPAAQTDATSGAAAAQPPGPAAGGDPGDAHQPAPPAPSGAANDEGGNAEDPIGCGKAGPTRKYVGKSADECARIRFACEPGFGYFRDDCGCGCAQQP